MSTLEKLIEQHQLMRHPEGGWYREMHRSTTQVERSDAAKRPGLTAILFLLPKEEISCWHRVSGADEAWIHIDGADLNLFQCTPDGSGLQEIVLNGENPLHVVPAGWWQAAQSNGSLCLG
jgi:predicted cupin superfamily sugar epimerase